MSYRSASLLFALLCGAGAAAAQAGQTLVVVATMTGCLKVRSQPAGDAAYLDPPACLASCTTVEGIASAPYWRRVRLADGRLGWVAKKFLAAAGTPAPADTSRDNAFLKYLKAGGHQGAVIDALIVSHLKLTYGTHSFLFVGDLEGKEREEAPTVLRYGEARLLAEAGPASLRSTVLKVAHHGSETSSTLPSSWSCRRATPQAGSIAPTRTMPPSTGRPPTTPMPTTS